MLWGPAKIYPLPKNVLVQIEWVFWCWVCSNKNTHTGTPLARFYGLKQLHLLQLHADTSFPSLGTSTTEIPPGWLPNPDPRSLPSGTFDHTWASHTPQISLKQSFPEGKVEIHHVQLLRRAEECPWSWQGHEVEDGVRTVRIRALHSCWGHGSCRRFELGSEEMLFFSTVYHFAHISMADASPCHGAPRRSLQMATAQTG